MFRLASSARQSGSTLTRAVGKAFTATPKNNLSMMHGRIEGLARLKSLPTSSVQQVSVHQRTLVTRLGNTVATSLSSTPSSRHIPKALDSLVRRSDFPHTLSRTITTTAVTEGTAAGTGLVQAWLASSAALCFGMIVLGGVTRLTESGLSMTDWKLLGSRPPSTQEAWLEEFERYKQFPEYKKLNMHMDVEDFKRIFWYEYSHRMLGRFIGGFYALPLAYFLARGRIPQPLRARSVGIGALIGGQGLLGWYMVKSGLDDDIDVPRVSQYRLAAHLTSALAIYGTMLWTLLDIRYPAMHAGGMTRVGGFINLARLTSAVIGTTIVSGAFVAGLDAGLVYNTFPKMADRWIPTDLIDESIQPAWRNIFENPTTVQFDHRILGTSSLALAYGLTAYGRGAKNMPKKVKVAMYHVAAIATAQVALGISTLLTFVHTHVAATHQATAVGLYSAVIWLLHELKRLPK